jgi:hypothetical protein
VLDRIETDPWFDQQDLGAADLRRAARQIATVIGDDSWRKIGTCWRVCRTPGLSEQTYARAAELGAWYDQHERPSAVADIVYGMALYRLGRYKEAHRKLEAAEVISAGDATGLTFLAMNRHALGDQEGAKASVAELQAMIAREHLEDDPDMRMLMLQVEGALEQRPILDASRGPGTVGTD